jgi:hypothetical protein
MRLSASPGLASRRQLQGGRMLSEAVSEWHQEQGEELGGGRISTGRTRGSLGVGWGGP